jgi:tRNA nucleotidyltransferase (CCA-adding enzyme)
MAQSLKELKLSSFVEHSHIRAFAETKVNLKREDVREYRDQVNGLRERLAEYIKDHPDYGLVKMLHAGSVMKGTALKTVNDMDVAVYVRPSDETTDEGRLLSWLVARLREVYPTMKPDQFTTRDHCVAVSFRGSGLDVDVVPVIAEEDDEDHGCLIVKDTGARVRTSVPLHLEFIRKRKKAQPDHFAQIVRLVKWWVRQRKSENASFRFKSFMVELICAKLADGGLDCSSYPHALERVCTYLVTTGLKEPIIFTDNYSSRAVPVSSSPIQIFDPVHPENNVADQYSDANRTSIVEAAADALDAITEAHYATTQGRAVEMWKIMFGPSFGVTL